MLLFSLPIREGLLSIATPTAIINLRLITEEQACALWREGSPYVHITRAGALRMFGRARVGMVVSYLAACKTPAEVRALRQVHPNSVLLRKACTIRLRALRELGVRV